jgi:hypothetical protein
LAGNYYFWTSLQGLNGRLGFKEYYDHDYDYNYDYNYDYKHKHKHELTGNCHDYKHNYGHVEPKPLIFKVRLVL